MTSTEDQSSRSASFDLFRSMTSAALFNRSMSLSLWGPRCWIHSLKACVAASPTFRPALTASPLRFLNASSSTSFMTTVEPR